MHRYCSCCGNDFNLEAGEIGRLGALGLPLHDWCLNCRLQLRLTFSNHHRFFAGTCAISGQPIESIYPPDSSLKIAASQLWWADGAIGFAGGRDFDFSRRFFEQFRELSLDLLKPAAIAFGGNDLPRSTVVFDSRGVYGSREILRGLGAGYCDSCSDLNWSIDCLGCRGLEQCIECIDSERLSGCTGLIRCTNVRDSDLCVDCHDSEFLLLCWNLQGKKYCILNRECTSEEFFRKKIELGMLNRRDRQVCDEMLEDIIFENTPPERRRRIPPRTLEDSRRIERLFVRPAGYFPGQPAACAADIIESVNVIGSQIHFSSGIYNCSDVHYSELCFNSSHLFGCSGLRGVEYAIFNRSYTRQEYEEQTKKITAHMRSTGEYGQFFPAEYSPFCYNESAAQQYFPLKEIDAEAYGFRWRPAAAPEPRLLEHSASYPIPDEIADVADRIMQHDLVCISCRSSYRILPPELQLYRTLSYPIPDRCPECRYQRRLEIQPAIIPEALSNEEPEVLPLLKVAGG